MIDRLIPVIDFIVSDFWILLGVAVAFAVVVTKVGFWLFHERNCPLCRPKRFPYRIHKTRVLRPTAYNRHPLTIHRH